jgi:hypothetical protein
MHRTVSTLLFALSLVSVGCSQDADPLTPEGAGASNARPLEGFGDDDEDSSGFEDGDDDSADGDFGDEGGDDDDSGDWEESEGDDADDREDSYQDDDGNGDDNDQSDDGDAADDDDTTQSEDGDADEGSDRAEGDGDEANDGADRAGGKDDEADEGSDRAGGKGGGADKGADRAGGKDGEGNEGANRAAGEQGETSDGAAQDPSEASPATDGLGSLADAGVSNDADPTAEPVAASGAVTLPPENAPFDYQLGGDYALPSGVRIVSRDRTGSAAVGAYNICYLNGLQTQPDERQTWLSAHSELLLKKSGNVVNDPEWPDEMLLDISTSAKRAALVELEAAWITECHSKGFAAIEIDNLDSYTRSGGLLTSEHAVAFVRALSDRAHAAGLAVAQKNSAELVSKKSALGTDFAVAEECAAYDECDAYTGAYGSHVLVVEYTRAAFQNACSMNPQLSIVLRDRDLVTPGQSGYVREGC